MSAIAPDIETALGHALPQDRDALAALFAIDAAMGDVVRTSSQDLLGAIRLAWWREQLEALDHGDVPAEPRLQAVASEVLPRGVTGQSIGALESGWRAMFEPFPWELPVIEAIWFRGRTLFRLAAQIIGSDDFGIEVDGGLWALADAARHCSDELSRARLLEQAATIAGGPRGKRRERVARPLSILGALAEYDVQQKQPFKQPDSPSRAMRLWMTVLFGRIG